MAFPPPRGGYPAPIPPPGEEPWQSRVARSILTTQGLGALLSLILVGFLIWGGSRLISDVREVGQAQVLQQERILTKLDEAIDHLKRIEALLETMGARP